MTVEQKGVKKYPCNQKRLNMSDSTFKKFCSITTAHGFSYLDAPSKHVRIFWLAILSFAFVAGVFHLQLMINEYLKYNYHETIITSTDVYPEFPDVTICDNSGLAEASIAKYVSDTSNFRIPVVHGAKFQ